MSFLLKISVMLHFLLFFEYADSLRMTSVRVPTHVAASGPAVLECSFELEDEVLYALKWYMNGNEFFRYQPGDDPPITVFKEFGLKVNEENSSMNHVTLADVPLSASGVYACEVSGEAPFFHTVSDHGEMTVVAVPSKGPIISGGKPRYQIGEWANLNCTVAESYPAATLAWFINGEAVDPTDLLGPWHSTLSPPKQHLLTTTLGLKFKVRSMHFRRGDMKIKCLAMIGTLYSRSNEESVEGDRLQRSPALESRNAVTAGPADSRADRVQASSSNTSSNSGGQVRPGGLLAACVLALLVGAGCERDGLARNR